MGKEALLLENEILRLGEDKVRNAAKDDYYGVGALAYPPLATTWRKHTPPTDGSFAPLPI